jgi:hypothetical protein
MCALWHIYTRVPRKRESPADVERWFRTQTAELWPAALGSLSLRKSPCIRDHCEACARGDQHASSVLYLRVKGRRIGLYIPEDLVPPIQHALENGRALQALLYEAGRRYINAMKHERRSSR